MSAFRTMSRGALVGTAVLACAAFAVPAANAAGTPQVTVVCDSGRSQFICQASVSGGTAPYTYDWTPYSHTYYVRGYCTPGYDVTATVTVTDAAGVTATGSGDIGCNPGIWV